MRECETVRNFRLADVGRRESFVVALCVCVCVRATNCDLADAADVGVLLLFCVYVVLCVFLFVHFVFAHRHRYPDVQRAIASMLRENETNSGDVLTLHTAYHPSYVMMIITLSFIFFSFVFFCSFCFVF